MWPGGTSYRGGARFGPREVRPLTAARARPQTLDPRANPLAKAAAWLRENL